MSTLVFRACLLPPGSLSFATVLAWEGADRVLARDPITRVGGGNCAPKSWRVDRCCLRGLECRCRSRWLHLSSSH